MLGEDKFRPVLRFLAGVAKMVAGIGAARRRETEATARALEEERRLATILRTAMDGFLVADADRRVVEANEAACRILGYSKEELLSLSVADFEGVMTDQEIARLNARMAETGESRFETRHRRKDGSLIDVEVSVQYQPSDGRFVSFFRDITERKKADQALTHSRDLMHYVIWNSCSSLAVHDSDLNYLYVSKRYLRDYKVQDVDVIGKHHYDVFPDLPQKWRDVHQRVLAGEVLGADEDRYDRDDGSVEWTRWECKPWYQADGAVGGIVVDTEVITDRVAAREALRESEARFRAIFDAAPFGIAVSRGGRQLFVNDAYAKLFGYDGPAAVVGTSLTDQLAPEAQGRARTPSELQEEGHPVANGFETVGRKQDGTTFPFRLAAISLRLPDGPATLVFAEDLSERKRAEEQKAALEAQLRQSQKMEAVGTLAGGIAHDFNNILTPIMGHAELALMQLGEAHPVRPDISALLTAAERARDLVRQILVITRKDAESLTVPLHLGPIIREVAKFMRASLPTTIEIRVEVAPDCGPVLGDPSQLHQVLLNLCTNAGYAMQERGGVLTISLEAAEGGSVGRALRLSVRDTGPGIPQEIASRIFEPYFTTKPMGKGSGLGLAMVHGIVTRLGGEIRFRSEEGKGAVFEVLLPEEARDASRTKSFESTVPRGQGQRVLVVDDEIEIGRVLERMLASLGYRATAHGSGVDALEAVRREPRAFDAVITDYTMPGLTGLDLARELLAIRPELPILLGTGFAEGVDDRVIAEHGIRELILKPYDLRKLGGALASVFGGSLEPGLESP